MKARRSELTVGAFRGAVDILDMTTRVYVTDQYATFILHRRLIIYHLGLLVKRGRIGKDFPDA